MRSKPLHAGDAVGLLDVASPVAPRIAPCCYAIGLALGFLFLSYRELPAQSGEPQVISGRVVTSDSQPIANARITVRGISGPATRNGTSGVRGEFRLLFPEDSAGYVVAGAAVSYSPSQLLVGGATRRATVGITLVLRPLTQVLPATRVAESRRPTRESVASDVSGADRPADAWVPPDVQGDLMQMAATLPGVITLFNPDGSVAGISVLGLPASQTAVTLNGLRLSLAAIPRDAGSTPRVAANPYDPARGGFSAAEVAVTAGPTAVSTSIAHGARLTVGSPETQFGSAAAPLPTAIRSVILSGRSAMPLIPDRLSGTLAWQVSDRAGPRQSLLEGGGNGQASLGISPDSIVRLISLLGHAGVPTAAPAQPADRDSKAASVYATLNYAKTQTLQTQSVFSASYGRADNTTLGARDFPSDGTRSESFNSFLSIGSSAYVGNAYLDDIRALFEVRRSTVSPYLAGPRGSVFLPSASAGGQSGGAYVGFGGAGNGPTSTAGGGLSFLNHLSRFSADGRHRWKVGVDARYDWLTQDAAPNLYGTVVYSSLAAVEGARPTSYARALTGLTSSGRAASLGLSLGDLFTIGPAVRVQYGLRVDGTAFPVARHRDPQLDAQLGVRTDRAPGYVSASPRIGFSWDVGRAPAGVVTDYNPRSFGTLRGGFGRFANVLGADALAGVGLGTAGAPVAQLLCLGPAAPSFNWADVIGHSERLPESCSTGPGATGIDATLPQWTVFGRGYRAPSSWRGNLEWNGYLSSAYRIGVNWTYSLNVDQTSIRDLNFARVVRFTLPSERGRPVYVSATDILPATGQVLPGGSRTVSAFGGVYGISGDGRSLGQQLTITLSPVVRAFYGANRVQWSVSYTTLNARARTAGFDGTTSGDPTAFEWARSPGGIRHQVNFTLSTVVFQGLALAAYGRLQSGAPFTPIVFGDINGDGNPVNDRAFIHDPSATPDTALAAGIRSLMTAAPLRIRECLTRTMNTVASAGSCDGSWSTQLNISASIITGQLGLPERLSTTLSLVNILSGLDALAHGGNTVGWSQSGTPDPVLLYVRGFDPIAKAFRYAVNPGFGSPRGSVGTPTSPFRIDLELKWAFGPSQQKQAVARQLDQLSRLAPSQLNARAVEARFDFQMAGTIPLLLVARDSLRLSAQQIDALSAAQQRLVMFTEQRFKPLADHAVEVRASSKDRDLVSGLVDAMADGYARLADELEKARELFTPEQLRRRPASTVLSDGFIAALRIQARRAGLYF